MLTFFVFVQFINVHSLVKIYERNCTCLTNSYPQCTWRAQPASQADSRSICFPSPSSIFHYSPSRCHSSLCFIPGLTTTSGAVARINRPEQLGLPPDQDHPPDLTEDTALPSPRPPQPPVSRCLRNAGFNRTALFM